MLLLDDVILAPGGHPPGHLQRAGVGHARQDETRRGGGECAQAGILITSSRLSRRRVRLIEPPPPRVCAGGGARTSFVSLLEHTLMDWL